MPLECAQTLPCQYFPQPKCRVSGEYKTTVRGEGSGTEPLGMPLKGAQASPRSNIPQSESLVLTRRKCEGAVGRKRYRMDFFRMPLKGAQALPRTSLHQRSGLFQPRLSLALLS